MRNVRSLASPPPDRGEEGKTPVNVTPKQLAVLRAIVESEYRTTLENLSETVWSVYIEVAEVSSRGMGGVFASLSKKGLVSLGGSGKESTVCLTPEGVAACVELGLWTPPAPPPAPPAEPAVAPEPLPYAPPARDFSACAPPVVAVASSPSEDAVREGFLLPFAPEPVPAPPVAPARCCESCFGAPACVCWSYAAGEEPRTVTNAGLPAPAEALPFLLRDETWKGAWFQNAKPDWSGRPVWFRRHVGRSYGGNGLAHVADWIESVTYDARGNACLTLAMTSEALRLKSFEAARTPEGAKVRADPALAERLGRLRTHPCHYGAEYVLAADCR